MVIVIIGVLAAFGVPRFLESVERSKAAEAFSYLSAIRDAQERYQAQNGTYASDVTRPGHPVRGADVLHRRHHCRGHHGPASELLDA